MRYTLVAGDTKLEDTRRYSHIDSMSQTDGSGGGPTVLLSLQNDVPSTWAWPNTTYIVPSTQKSITFFTWMGYITAVNENTDQTPVLQDQPVALLTFLDYVLNTKNVAYNMSYLMIPANALFTVFPNSIFTPTTSGRHDILAVRINYPGVPMCLLQGDRNGVTFAHEPEVNRVSFTIQ